MKRRDELIVGATILAAIAVVIAGALWLSEAHLGQSGQTYVARFRTVGGLGVGNPVVLRGVRVGRVQEIRLAEGEWVETVFQLYPDAIVGASPGVIAASASLFGEWHASIINLEEAEITDQDVRRQLDEASAMDDEVWPGATLPDIGQLTAQAGRIAGDIGAFSQRIEDAFNDEAVVHLQSSIRDFGQVASQINAFAGQQTDILGDVAGNVQVTSQVVSETALLLERVMERFDGATSEGELDSIISNTDLITRELRVTMEEFRGFVGMVSDNGPALGRIIAGADSAMTRFYQGDGTVGRLMSDSTLYVETALAIQELRALIVDIQENPRKYFKFSVF